MIKPKGLGRGLDALLGSAESESRGSESSGTLPVDKIRPGKYQPRTRMNKEALEELASSIKTRGLMQPVVVRPIDPDTYELIAGERRWRAAQIAGLARIPAIVREVPDEAALAMSLIENIQREDLNPIEEAAGIQRLVEEFRLTHEQAADAVGRSRSATTNLLRLLKLAPPVRIMVMDGFLDMGHARALLPLDGATQVELANRILSKGLSVREAEALAVRGSSNTPRSRPGQRRDRDIARLEEEVSEALGTTVRIQHGRKGAGKLVVHYAGLDHLDRLLGKLR